MKTTLAALEITVTYAGRLSNKCPSRYLRNAVWVEKVKSTTKGVNFRSVDDGTTEKAKRLALTMQYCFDLHISDPTRIHKSRRHHYTLEFTQEKISAIAALLCLSDHAVDDLESFKVDECLLTHPLDDNGLRSVGNKSAGSNLSSLEGTYLHYDKVKRKWSRSGKAFGAGKDACFQGREHTHAK